MGAGRYQRLIPPAPSAKVLILDLRDGAARTLAEGPFIDLVMSPGSKRLALIAEAEPLPARLEPPSVY